MQRFILYYCILAFCLSLKAQTYLKAAGNISWFETTNVEAKPGFSLALGHQWHVYKGFGLGGGFRLSQRRLNLKDKTYNSYGKENFIPEYDDIRYANFNILKRSVDIPIHLNKKISINNSQFQFSIGYSISFDLESEHKIEVTDKEPFSELSDNEKNTFDFDYESIGDLELMGSGHESIEIGFSINIYKQYFIHCIFVRSYIKHIDGIYFKEYMDTIALGVGLNI